MTTNDLNTGALKSGSKEGVATTKEASPCLPPQSGVATPIPASRLFTATGKISDSLKRFLLSLPAPNPECGDALSLKARAQIEGGAILLRELDDYLQEAVFRKNAGKFSYELGGAAPTPEQQQLLAELGFCGEVRVPAGTRFDSAVVWGGTLAAVENRINMLLDQGVDFSRVLLLGTNKRVLDKGEKTHPSETLAAMQSFLARANEKTGRTYSPESFPTNESEMMTFAWQALKPVLQESLPAFTVDTPGRPPEHLLAQYKHVPGTADTFGYLLLFARENGLDIGTRFIAASSQPHVLRQTQDAEYKLLSVDHPFELLCGIGAANSGASLSLYLQELAKLVNTQRRIAMGNG